MIPRPPQGLADLAVKLATAVAPETCSRYAEASTGMISMLLLALAQDMERAVAVRMEDVDELKALFADVPAEAGGDHAARTAFLDARPASLRLADVEALHAEGLTLLIDLHGWAEGSHPGLDERIWAFLVRHSERHRLDLPAL